MENQNIAERLSKLEQIVQRHEKRIADLETRLDPKTRDDVFNAALNDLLDELTGLY